MHAMMKYQAPVTTVEKTEFERLLDQPIELGAKPSLVDEVEQLRVRVKDLEFGTMRLERAFREQARLLDELRARAVMAVETVCRVCGSPTCPCPDRVSVREFDARRNPYLMR